MEAPETSLARVHGDIYKKRKKRNPASSTRE
jgi:hypothetical protein